MEQPIPISVTIDKPFLVVHMNNKEWYYDMKRWTEQRAIADVKSSNAAKVELEATKPKKKKKSVVSTKDTGIFT